MMTMKGLVFFFVLTIVGCNAKRHNHAEQTSFIDTVQRYSNPHAPAIRLDTLVAENFPVIPHAFFVKYYAPHLKSESYDWSVPPDNTIYWRFSFLTFDKGRQYDFQKIIGYFEVKGIYVYLVVLDKVSHAVIDVQPIAYSGGDGGYYEQDLLTQLSPETYTNLHTVGEEDETSLADDFTRIDLLIQTISLTVPPNGRLTADTTAIRQAVEKQYNEAKQRPD